MLVFVIVLGVDVGIGVGVDVGVGDDIVIDSGIRFCVVGIGVGC